MAFGSHTLSRSHSVGVSSVEGLQMKLSDNVKPTPEVFLPHHFQLAESSVLNGGEYNFEAEEAFLSWIQDIVENKKRHQESLKKFENERRAEQNNKRINQHDSEEELEQRKRALKRPTPNSDPVLTPVQAQLGTDILMPIPSGGTDKERVDDGKKMVTSHSSNHLFDLAEFETVSDPFEATELQTLNDMEELKNVLASSSSAVPPPMNGDDENDYGSNCSGIDEEQAKSSEVSTAPAEDSPSTSNATNHSQETETGQNIGHEVQLRTKTEAVAFKMSKPVAEVSVKSQSVPKDSHYMNESQVDHEDLSQSLDNFLSHSTLMDRNTVLNSAPLPPIPSRPVQTKPQDDTIPVFSYQNGIPSDQRKRSESSPPGEATSSLHVSNHSFATTPPGYPNNLNKYEPLPPPPATSSTGMRSEVRPKDPDFTALDEESQVFASMIISMGFPEGRTARAVKRLGHDDRLVVDALCAVDRLCGQGFGEKQVEEALHLLDNNDEKKVLAFLKLWKQFEELGFKPDDIKRELLLHGNEEEKVLDALTAKP